MFSTNPDLGPSRRPAPTGEPYYGVPAEKHHEHMMKCPRCRKNARGMGRCPSYVALDREFFLRHVAEGGATERHFSCVVKAVG